MRPAGPHRDNEGIVSEPEIETEGRSSTAQKTTNRGMQIAASITTPERV